DLTWSRARDIVGGRFSADGHDSLLVAYQDDGARMRVLSFVPSGGAFLTPTTVYDSGTDQIDLAKTRLAVGHFTRATGGDQLVALTQAKTHAKLALFDPGAGGLTRSDLDDDVSRAAIAAADLGANGLQDVVALYPAADGSARVAVFEAAASFRPATPLVAAPTLSPRARRRWARCARSCSRAPAAASRSRRRRMRACSVPPGR